MQRMTETPPSTAALVLRAMNCSVEVSWGVFTLGEMWIVEVWGNCEDAYLVGLLKDDTALAVADDSPVDLGIAELLNADLTGESTVGLVDRRSGQQRRCWGWRAHGSERGRGREER